VAAVTVPSLRSAANRGTAGTATLAAPTTSAAPAARWTAESVRSGLVDVPGGGLRVARIGDVGRVARPWHPGLRPYLRGYAGYWDTGAGAYRVRMLPQDRIVMVLNLGRPFRQVSLPGMPADGGLGIGSLVAGLADGPGVVDHPGGQEAIRIEFTPLGAYRFFGRPMRELAGIAVDLHEVLGPDALRLAERLAATPDWSRRFTLLDTFLLARLDRGPAPSPEVAHAWNLLASSGGTTPVAAVAAEVGWSREHLVRRFAEQVGMAPKGSARVLRFQRALGMLRRPDVRLVAVAAACGYSDQAHLSREFQALAGITPGALLGVQRAEGAVRF
jgi:AraC-like DNA-binding protein